MPSPSTPPEGVKSMHRVILWSLYYQVSGQEDASIAVILRYSIE